MSSTTSIAVSTIPRRLTTRDLDALSPRMRERVDQLVLRASEAGLQLQGVDAYRSPWDQARLFRQGHDRAEIVAQQAHLTALGWPELAAMLDEVGPQPSGPCVTNAGPGNGWHGYGLAWDSVPVIAGRLAWLVREGEPEYDAAEAAWETYGRCVREVGLTWGGSWGDRPHCQLYPASATPLATLSRAEIRAWGVTCGWWPA